jgi:hypothetical protein
MNRLGFRIVSARAELYAAQPMLAFRVELTNAGPGRIHAAALRCQVQIDTRKRSHSDAEGERLRDLFGERQRWAQTLRPLLWFHADRVVPGFEDRVEVDLPVVCSYDFDVAAHKYLQALDDGEVPLLFLWSGTLFVASERGFSIEQIPWDREARFRLPVPIWREVMDHYFPNSAWLRLERRTFDALWRVRNRLGATSWDEVIDDLLDEREATRATEETA